MPRRHRSGRYSAPRYAAAITYRSPPPAFPLHLETGYPPVFPLAGAGRAGPRQPYNREKRKPFRRLAQALPQARPFRQQSSRSQFAPRLVYSNPTSIGYWSTDSQEPDKRIPAPPGSTICQRRSTRRSALFALGRTGKGSLSKRHHTLESKISCLSQA